MPVKMTVEDASARLAQFGYEMVNPEMYQDTNTRLTFKCTTHNRSWEGTSTQAWRLHKKCPECPTESWQDALARKKFTLQCTEEEANACLPNERIPVICEAGHSFEIKRSYATSHSCQECLGRKIPFSQVEQKLATLGFTLVNSEEFKNTRLEGNFECREGHKWTTSIHNVISEKSACPECGMGLNERKALWAISKLTGGVFHKTRDVLPSKFELDGYCEELKLAIEYNGIQHYEFIGGHFHKGGVEKFESQQLRDEIKSDECADMGIRLIIVPYTCKTFESIWECVTKELVDFGIQLLDVDMTASQSEYQQSFRPLMSNMQTFHDLATAKGGACVSSAYEGETHAYTYQCKDPSHDPFTMTKFDIIRGRWCRMCSKNAPISIDKINSIVGEHGFVFASPAYNKGTDKYDFKCTTCGFIQNTSWENFKQRCSRGCKQCKPIKPGRGSANYPANPKPRKAVVIPDERKLEHLTTLQQIANGKGGECLSTEYLGHQVKHLFRCSAGHEWEATSNSIKLGTWCKVCKISSRSKDDITSARAFCQSNGWVFASPAYTGATAKYTYKCAKCELTRELAWSSFKARATLGCSKCKEAAK